MSTKWKGIADGDVMIQTPHGAQRSGADPVFFLGGGALVSCSTSTSINHIVFFCRIPVVLEKRRSSQGKGGGGRTPRTLPLDPPLEMRTGNKDQVESSIVNLASF